MTRQQRDKSMSLHEANVLLGPVANLQWGITFPTALLVLTALQLTQLQPMLRIRLIDSPRWRGAPTSKNLSSQLGGATVERRNV
jgi:hypothetical protein